MVGIVNNTALIISICVVIGIFLIVGSLNWILAAIYKHDNPPHSYDMEGIVNNIEHITDSISQFGESTEEACSSLENLRKAIYTPILTPNEARKMLGIDAIEDPSPELISLPLEDNISVEHIRYICPACGTIYIHNGCGFIPNCQNCGSQLVEQVQMIVKKPLQRKF